jgi:hypothetical protein
LILAQEIIEDLDINLGINKFDTCKRLMPDTQMIPDNPFDTRPTRELRPGDHFMLGKVR